MRWSFQCPRSNDEGVKGFKCMSVEEVEAALKAGEFTPANGCVILDFLVRRGLLTYEQEMLRLLRDFIRCCIPSM